MADTSSRRPLISGNWKMNLNHFEAIQTVQKLNWALKPEDYRAAEVTVHPPFTDLRSIQTLVEADNMPIVLGAQNCHWEDTGAYTGEVSPAMLAKLNVSYVIAGHSERRQHFGETDEIVNKKVLSILRNEMSVILCVGETLEQREAGEAESVVSAQLRAAFAGVKKDDMVRVAVAYEPIWAIGTGKTATVEDAQSICAYAREVLGVIFDEEVAQATRIQYGGSVKGSNARDLIAAADIDGFLVGGASLNPDDFAKIVASAHD